MLKHQRLNFYVSVRKIWRIFSNQKIVLQEKNHILFLHKTNNTLIALELGSEC